MAKVTKSISAENVFSDAIELYGQFNFVLWGDGNSIVHLQRSFDGSGGPWLDIGSYFAQTQFVGTEPESGVNYRFGVKTGNFRDGTVDGRLSQ